MDVRVYTVLVVAVFAAAIVEAKNKVACEGNLLTIRCKEEGEVLNIKEAVYGRLVNHICKPQNPESTGCSLEGATEIVQESCQGQVKCTIDAASKFTTDPCPGTSKYLKVIYGCRKANV